MTGTFYIHPVNDEPYKKALSANKGEGGNALDEELKDGFKKDMTRFLNQLNGKQCFNYADNRKINCDCLKSFLTSNSNHVQLADVVTKFYCENNKQQRNDLVFQRIKNVMKLSRSGKRVKGQCFKIHFKQTT